MPAFMPDAAHGPAFPPIVEPSALHQASNLDTNIACDIDFAFGHACANAVEAFVAPLKPDLHCVAHADLEKLSRTQTHASLSATRWRRSRFH